MSALDSTKSHSNPITYPMYRENNGASVLLQRRKPASDNHQPTLFSQERED